MSGKILKQGGFVEEVYFYTTFLKDLLQFGKKNVSLNEGSRYSVINALYICVTAKGHAKCTSIKPRHFQIIDVGSSEYLI